MLYLGIFFAFLLLLLIIPVNVALMLKIENKSLLFSMKIYIIKIRIYYKSIDIPDIFTERKKDLNDEAIESKNKKKARKKEVRNISILSKINIIISLYCSNRNRFIRIKNYIKGKIKLKDIDLYIAEGTGDAAITGLLYGILWSFVGSTSAIISNFVTTSFKNISLNCDYNNKIFKLHLNSILTFSIANIIIMFIRLNYIIKRYKLSVKKL